MRPLLALIVVASILGGMQMYMMLRPQPNVASTPRELTAAGDFQLEITMTFAAGADPFALDLADAPSLLVTFRGQQLLRMTEQIDAGQTIRVDQIKGVVAGVNEFYVQATPRDQTATAAYAVRVRVLRDNQPIAEESLWSEPGALVEGIILIDVQTQVFGGATGDTTES